MIRKRALAVILLVMSETFAVFVVSGQSAQPSIFDLAWNFDGTQLAAARGDGMVEIFNRQGESLAIHEVFTAQEVITVAWSPTDPDKLAVGGYNGSAKVIDLAQNPPTTSLELSPLVHFVYQIEWSPDGSKIAVLGESGGRGASGENLLTIWDALRPAQLLAAYRRNFDSPQPTQIEWSPVDSNLLAIASITNGYGAEIRLWNVSNNEVLWQLQEPDLGVLSLAWNPDGSEIAFAGGNILLQGQIILDDAIRLHVVNAATGRISPSMMMGAISNQPRLAWSPNSHLAAAGRELQIWNMDYQGIIDKRDLYCREITWSPSGDLACLNENVQILSGLDNSDP